MKETYIPTPADIADISLPPELMDLGEIIAENVHDVWSLNRIAEGWSYGEQRDERLKKTPCLVPYDQLSETEKNFDRNTAISTLKLIMKLGFEIRPMEK